MLHIANLEEIQGEIIKISGLVDLQQRRDFSFDEKVKLWLSNLEKILENNRIMQAGEIASLRAMIISAENEIVPPGIEVNGRVTKRKILEATLSYALHQAGNIVSEYLEEDMTRISGAERMVRQLIAMAKAKGLFQQIPDGNDHTKALKIIWQTLSEDPDIAPGTINVEGLVGPQDALIILDRIIAIDKSTS